MPSRQNAEIVRRVFEAAARDDTAAVLALYDPDIVWDASRTERGTMAGRVVQGRDALLQWLREWYEAWARVDDNLERVVEAGEDKVVSIMVQRARGRASGVEVENELGTIWTVREQKVVRVEWFQSGAEALRAAGVSDEDDQSVT